jgi:hypothetical protein
VLDDHAPCHAPSGVAHQVLEQRELFRSQVDSSVGALHPAFDPVKGEIEHAQRRLRRRTPAPQQSPHARREFGVGKWFVQAVVRPRVESLHAIFHAAARRQHQHRQIRLARTDVVQQRQAVHLRQIEVEHHQVVVEILGHGAALFAVGCHIHCVVFFFKTLAHKARQRCIVFYNQDSHLIRLVSWILASIQFVAGAATPSSAPEGICAISCGFSCMGSSSTRGR